MRTLSLFLLLILSASLQTEINAQSGAEKIWKDLSRLPQNLRDDLKKSPWWKSTAGGNTAQTRLDSTIKFSSFNSSKAFPLNKSKFEYPSAMVAVQSDFVNYGQWVLEKRTTITRNGQNRIIEVLEEEPDPLNGVLQPVSRLNLYWHGNSGDRCDSVISSRWDDQWQQWTPAYRLLSFFDAQDRETATETYRYDYGVQVIGIREEYQPDAAGDNAVTRQFLAKDGKWTLLGKVESKFDKQHHETARLEDVALDGDRFASVRRLKRTFDTKGNLALEERFKWNAPSNEWSPLKSISRGYDAKNHSEWAITESYKPNTTFKNKLETFKRKNDENTDREVLSSYADDLKKWQVVSEMRYYYSR